MRNRGLHDALRDFALEAAAGLSRELDAGAELRFDVDEEPGTGSVLYNYRPLTGAFIAERWPLLRSLPACPPAATALGTGARAYLHVRGEPAGDSEPALRVMLERIYEGATDFGFPEERFERVYSEVERALYRDAARAVVIVPLHGLALESDRVELGDGLALAAGGGGVDAPPEAVWAQAPGESEAPPGEPNAVMILERDDSLAAEAPRAEAIARFVELVRAMRLFKTGRVALHPLAWTRVGDGPWRVAALAGGGPARGQPWALTRAEEPALGELLEVMATANPTGAVGWALRRFDMGAERALEADALSDYLLALSALLDADDDAGRASLSLRVAALCAEEHDRRPVQRRLGLAYSLERFLIGGRSGGEFYLEAVGPESPAALVHEVEDLLRALLKDVLCGYLGPNLRAAADEVLLERNAEIDVKATHLRGAERFEEPGESPERFTPAPEDGVTPSADWGAENGSAPGVEEESAGYGAPV